MAFLLSFEIGISNLLGVSLILEKDVIALVREVGAFQLQYFRNIEDSKINKKGSKETVSFLDVESEKLLKKGLQKLLPEAGFFGEELGTEGDSSYRWIVDPIDGTTNFLNGIDQFSISVALVKEEEILLGVVYKPYIDEALSASKGLGIRKNGEASPIHTHKSEAKEALFSTGFPFRSPDLSDAFFKTAKEVLQLGMGIRRQGSAALDLAYLGMGWYDGFWEGDLQPYDAAGALAIIYEAGLLVTNHRGEPYNMFQDRMMVAAPDGVHQPLLEIVARNYKDCRL